VRIRVSADDLLILDYYDGTRTVGRGYALLSIAHLESLRLLYTERFAMILGHLCAVTGNVYLKIHFFLPTWRVLSLFLPIRPFCRAQKLFCLYVTQNMIF